MATRSPETIAEVTIPDSALVREATEFIRDTADELLFHHSRRVFLFGALHTTMNADVLEHYDPTFVRDDFVDIILNSSWPE